jgi:hypothetical protein
VADNVHSHDQDRQDTKENEQAPARAKAVFADEYLV